MPDADDDLDGKKARRAAGLNESVVTAYAELERSVSTPGVRESLPTPMGCPIRPPWDGVR